MSYFVSALIFTFGVLIFSGESNAIDIRLFSPIGLILLGLTLAYSSIGYIPYYFFIQRSKNYSYISKFSLGAILGFACPLAFITFLIGPDRPMYGFSASVLLSTFACLIFYILPSSAKSKNRGPLMLPRSRCQLIY